MCITHTLVYASSSLETHVYKKAEQFVLAVTVDPLPGHEQVTSNRKVFCVFKKEGNFTHMSVSTIFKRGTIKKGSSLKR